MPERQFESQYFGTGFVVVFKEFEKLNKLPAKGNIMMKLKFVFASLLMISGIFASSTLKADVASDANPPAVENPDRLFIVGEDLSQFLLAKPLDIVRARDGAAVRLSFKQTGEVSSNTIRTQGRPIYVTGTWKLNDYKVKACMSFNDPNNKDMCFGIFKEAGELKIWIGPKNEPVVFGSLK